MNNKIFKPTPLYKEFMILDIISKNEDVTQRVLSKELNISVSMVNEYLEEYENKGYLKREYKSIKTVKYVITKEGIERKKLLNINFLEASLDIYTKAKENITLFLNQIIEKGFKNILFYGAGEVAEIMLNVINSDNTIPLNVLAIIDDNEEKQGTMINNTKVISIDDMNKYQYDGIMISSYIHNKVIYQNLIKNKVEKNKILRFFEENN